jgi:hypothetical protein
VSTPPDLHADDQVWPGLGVGPVFTNPVEHDCGFAAEFLVVAGPAAPGEQQLGASPMAHYDLRSFSKA